MSLSVLIRSQSDTDNRHMPKCRAATDDGSPCKNPVKKAGMRCHVKSHRGQPAVPPGQGRPRKRVSGQSRRRSVRTGPRPQRSRSSRRPAKRRTRKKKAPRAHTPERLTARQQQRVDAAVQACSDVLADGWKETVADRASEYVTTGTFEALKRHRRRRCRGLADIAQAILDGRTKLHDLIGSFAGWLASVVGRSRIEQRFAREFAKRIPLPNEGKLITAARGVQVAGVLLCVLNDDDLSRCQCFIDLALEQSKTALKRLLETAMENWMALTAFPAKRTA